MKSREPVKANRDVELGRFELTRLFPSRRSEPRNSERPLLTSHNRPGKRFAATLDSAPHKRNQINDQELHVYDALPGASERNLWQRDFCAFDLPHYRFVISEPSFVECVL
jgi:hypothetical protein